MYTDKKRRRWPIFLAGVVTAAALVFAFWLSVGGAPDPQVEGAQAIRASIQSCALQCYVVEGVYPSSLSYLEEQYGLRVNREDYYVAYTVFASNLPPDVKVVARD